jgi:hypothetical protein
LKLEDRLVQFVEFVSNDMLKNIKLVGPCFSQELLNTLVTLMPNIEMLSNHEIDYGGKIKTEERIRLTNIVRFDLTIFKKLGDLRTR